MIVVFPAPEGPFSTVMRRAGISMLTPEMMARSPWENDTSSKRQASASIGTRVPGLSSRLASASAICSTMRTYERSYFTDCCTAFCTLEMMSLILRKITPITTISGRVTFHDV